MKKYIVADKNEFNKLKKDLKGFSKNHAGKFIQDSEQTAGETKFTGDDGEWRVLSYNDDSEPESLDKNKFKPNGNHKGGKIMDAAEIQDFVIQNTTQREF